MSQSRTQENGTTQTEGVCMCAGDTKDLKQKVHVHVYVLGHPKTKHKNQTYYKHLYVFCLFFQFQS